MTVLLVGVPEGAELELLRSRIQRNPHFRVISHAHTPDIALAHARILLPDITVLTLPGNLREDPTALHVFQGVRALDPPSGVVLRTRADTPPTTSTASPPTEPSTTSAPATKKASCEPSAPSDYAVPAATPTKHPEPHPTTTAPPNTPHPAGTRTGTREWERDGSGGRPSAGGSRPDVHRQTTPGTPLL